MGLAQVYGIVKQHEGEIEVVSHLAQDAGHRPGTTFTLYLPVLAEAVVEQTAVQDLPSAAEKGETILLVEDDAHTREAVLHTLSDLGYEVLVAVTGEEALALFSQNPEGIDLVLLDTVMPEMGGIELYRELRRRRPETKMVLMSGYPPANITDLKGSQVIWMQKPFTADELAHKVRQVLND